MIVNETILGFLWYLEKFIAIKCYLVLLYQIAFGNFHQTPIYIVPKYYIAKFSERTLPHPAYMPLYSTLHPPCTDSKLTSNTISVYRQFLKQLHH